MVNVKVGALGSVTVRRGNDGEVVVDSQVIEPESIDYSVTQNANAVAVTSRVKSWSPFLWGSYFFSGGPRTNITVTVPREADLILETTTDPISANGIRGLLDVESKTGSIHLTECEGSVNARTHTGTVDLENVNGNMAARSTTGSIRFLGSLSTGDNSFRATTGSIDIALTGNPDLRLDASTTVGQITCSLDLGDARYEKGQYIGQHITGRIGAGAGRLTVETTVGSISIHK